MAAWGREAEIPGRDRQSVDLDLAGSHHLAALQNRVLSYRHQNRHWDRSRRPVCFHHRDENHRPIRCHLVYCHHWDGILHHCLLYDHLRRHLHGDRH